MTLTQIMLVLAISSIVLPLGIRGIAWRRVRERRLRAPRIRLASPDALPERLDPIYEAAERVLRPLGFEPAGARRAEAVYACEDDSPERVYRHADGATLAFVAPPTPGMGERPYRVTFVSSMDDGSVVATFDGRERLTPGSPPAWDCQDHDVNDLGKQWEHHREALEAKRDATPVGVRLHDWNDAEERALEEALLRWEAEGLTRRAGSGPSGRPRWRFRSLAAWSLAGRFLQGQRRVLAEEAEAERTRARQQLWRDGLDPVTDAMEPGLAAARAAAMAWEFELERRAGARRRARGGRSRLRLAALAAASFALILAWWIGWELAAILIVVLAIHDLGHVAATEAFGIEDRRLLFVPLWRGRDPGEKTATPRERTLVYLLGPAPGMLLGLAALYAFLQGGGFWWLAAATTALLINWLNLLPLSPLDGGRVVETLFLGRFPRAQVAFLGAGAVAFGAAAWALREPILAGISIALLISLRTAWAAAKALARARGRIPARSDEEARVRAVFELLQEAPYDAAPAARRMRLAERIIPRLRHEPARPGTALLGGLAYLVMLFGAPAGVVLSVSAFAPEGWPPAGTAAGRPLAIEARPEAAPAAALPPRNGYVPGGGTRAQPSSSSISEASLVGR